MRLLLLGALVLAAAPQPMPESAYKGQVRAEMTMLAGGLSAYANGQRTAAAERRVVAATRARLEDLRPPARHAGDHLLLVTGLHRFEIDLGSGRNRVIVMRSPGLAQAYAAADRIADLGIAEAMERRARVIERLARARPAAARPGAALFYDSGCLSCHTYRDEGSANLGAPDLTREARRHRGLRWQVAHLRCPGCKVPGSPMPSFTMLGAASLQELAVFLEASTG